MIRLLAYIAGGIVSVLLIGTVFGDRLATYEDETAVLLFGAALGALTFFIKPIISAISLPVTCLTFGLFALVINAVFFALAARITPGVDVTWLGAFVGGIAASAVTGVVFSILDDDSIDETVANS
jgi:putative membrane protein